jgi:hypothetical protein
VGTRIYVDADVVLDLASLRRLIAAVGRGDCLAAAPEIQHDLTGASWAVRSFYRVDRAMPSARQPIGGSGVYAVSAAGRKRWAKFPDITADDGFVQRQFAAHERKLVEEAVSIVTPPKCLAGLVMIKTRSHFGTYELAEKFPQLSGNRGPGNRQALMCLALRPGWWPSLGVYGYVKVMARLRAKRQMRQRRARPDAPVVWERDETSRQPIAA